MSLAGEFGQVDPHGGANAALFHLDAVAGLAHIAVYLHDVGIFAAADHIAQPPPSLSLLMRPLVVIWLCRMTAFSAAEKRRCRWCCSVRCGYRWRPSCWLRNGMNLRCCLCAGNGIDGAAKRAGNRCCFRRRINGRAADGTFHLRHDDAPLWMRWTKKGCIIERVSKARQVQFRADSLAI